MNRKELAEIRRRLNPDKNTVLFARGCYVNDKKEIEADFERPMALFDGEENEKFCALFRRTLSGVPGKNLVDVAFDTREVMEGTAHKLLMTLRDSALRDGEAVNALFRTVIDNLETEDGQHYLILLLYDAYDVPYRAKDGLKALDSSEEMFPYLICSVCPVKQIKPGLSYNVLDRAFHSRGEDWVVAAPELGFLFPAFDDRSSNIYNALYYTRDTAAAHDELAQALFHTALPMPAAEQKEVFQAILQDTLAEELSMEVLQSVHAQVVDLIEENKADRESEKPVVSRREVKQMLEACGVREERVAAFSDRFEEEFGANMEVCAQNIVDDKKFEVRTADVVIHVNPARSDLVETRMIDGHKYILIRADEGVEVNGVDVAIR